MSRRRMKKNGIKRFLVFLTVLSMLFGLVQTASAGLYEPGRKGSFTLTLKEGTDGTNQKVLPGIGLRLYRVGSVNNNSGAISFVIDPALASTGVDFGNLTTADVSVKAANTLAGVIKTSGLAFQEAVTDANGTVRFGNLDLGMYLIVQSVDNSKMKVSPMLLSLPYMVDADTWLYDVNAYPKAETQVDNGSIHVVKQTYYVDEDFNMVPLALKDSTFHVALYLDSAGTIPFRDDYRKQIRVSGSTSGSAVYTDVLPGTYYLFETDSSGNNIPIGKAQVDENGNTVNCVITDSNGQESNQTSVSSGGQNTVYVNNYYYDLPEGDYIEGTLKIQKLVKRNGSTTTVDDQFYASAFQKDSNGNLELVDTVELKQNGVVEMKLMLKDGIEDTTFTILETDKDGNPINQDEFGYTVKGEGDITIKKDDLEKSLIITNEIKTEATSTPRPTVTTTPGRTTSYTTPARSTINTTTTSTTASSVKTGDDTPIAVWIGALAAAAVIIGAVIFRKKEKEQR